MKADHPVYLLPVFVAMIIAEFIDHKEQYNKGDRQWDGESQRIDTGIEFITGEEPKGGFEVVSEHCCWS